MNLIVDIGNTRVKYSVFENSNLVAESASKRLTHEKIASILAKFSVDRCIVSAVGSYNVQAMSFLASSIPTAMLSCQTPIPIKNCYSTPQTLGCDRIAVAVAANYLRPNTNILVIDCGTAITYDVITSNAEYLGGAISPGINLRFKSLNLFTAKLPLLSFNSQAELVGQTTEACIWSGVQNGVIAEIDGYIVEAKKKFSGLMVFLTGGDAKSFVNKLKKPIFVTPNLLALGLNVILEYNKPDL